MMLLLQLPIIKWANAGLKSSAFLSNDSQERIFGQSVLDQLDRLQPQDRGIKMEGLT